MTAVIHLCGFQRVSKSKNGRFKVSATLTLENSVLAVMDINVDFREFRNRESEGSRCHQH